MAVHVTPATAPADTRERIVELVGRVESTRRAPAELADTPAILALQLQAVDTFVEMIRLRTALADRDRRITSLTTGLQTWRQRASEERVARRREEREGREREREIISLLHQQMQVADAATAELERIRALPWWRRLRG